MSAQPCDGEHWADRLAAAIAECEAMGLPIELHVPDEPSAAIRQLMATLGVEVVIDPGYSPPDALLT